MDHSKSQNTTDGNGQREGDGLPAVYLPRAPEDGPAAKISAPPPGVTPEAQELCDWIMDVIVCRPVQAADIEHFKNRLSSRYIPMLGAGHIRALLRRKAESIQKARNPIPYLSSILDAQCANPEAIDDVCPQCGLDIRGRECWQNWGGRLVYVCKCGGHCKSRWAYPGKEGDPATEAWGEYQRHVKHEERKAAAFSRGQRDEPVSLAKAMEEVSKELAGEAFAL